MGNETFYMEGTYVEEDFPIWPTESDFLKLSNDGYGIIPVYSRLLLDRETPISLYYRFLSERPTFLLESSGHVEDTGRYSFMGLEPIWTLRSTADEVFVSGDTGEPTPAYGKADNPIKVLKAFLGQYKVHIPPELPPFFGGAVGHVSYDYIRRVERIPKRHPETGWPETAFVMPRVVIAYDHLRQQAWVTYTAVLPQSADGNYASDAYAVATARVRHLLNRLLEPINRYDGFAEGKVKNAVHRAAAINVESLASALSDTGRERYIANVERAKEYVYAGDVFQVVPSHKFIRPFTAAPIILYRVLRALNPSPYMYLLDMGDHQLVGTSPEMVMRVEQRRLLSRPIAGSRPRGRDTAEDEQLAGELQQDPKELAEHLMLLDLARNDVGRVAEIGSVRVEKLRIVESYSHIMHLVSEVSGNLPSGFDAYDALDATFPAGTISGAPKIRAMEIIDELEVANRDAYGGAVGYFSLSGNADFAITIRTISLSDGKAVVQAGAGIVADSVPQREYEESVHKASAGLLALEVVEPLGEDLSR